MAEDILVPIALFATIGAIWIAAIIMNARTRRDQQETLRQLAANGQTLSPDLISSLHKPVRSADQDLRSGVVLTALAIGLALSGILFGTGLLAGTDADFESTQGFFIAAIIVGALGIGQLVAWRMRREPRG